MQLDNYVKLGRGKQMHLAKAINAQPQLVYQWANAIERATGGVVTRKDLRPDDWWKIWPELAEDGAGIVRPEPDGAGGGDEDDAAAVLANARR